MIKVLGAKRILTIVILLALNVVLGAGVYFYLMPEKIKKDKELRTLKNEISTSQSDINRMQVEYDQLTKQQTDFEKLRDRGFFGKQGRREAEIVLEKIQKQAGVVSAVATIGRGTVEDNEEAQKAEHKILVSPVVVAISAVDDVDVFRYIYLLEQFFPGHIAIQKITMKRQAEVSGIVLRSIASGNNPQLVKAELSILWRSMIPQKDIIGPEGGPSQ